MSDQALIENTVQRMTQWVYDFGSEKNPQFIDDLKLLLSVVKTETPYVPPTPIDPGEGWRLLAIGEDPKYGDEVRCPNSKWAPLACDFEPGQRKGWYYRRRIEPAYRPFASAEEYKPHRYKGIIVGSNVNIFRNWDYYNDTHIAIARLQEVLTWDKAFEKLKFEDGSPFGPRVTE